MTEIKPPANPDHELISRTLLASRKYDYMKPILLLLALSCFYQLSVAQQPTTEGSREQYMQKSKQQQTAAWVLTGGGVAMVVAGLVSSQSNRSYVPNEQIGTGLIIAGGAAITGGIVLFTASGRNKDRAHSIAASILLQQTINGSHLTMKLLPEKFPAIGIAIRL